VPVWNARMEIARVAKPEDSRVPVQLPLTSAGSCGDGEGPVGSGAGEEGVVGTGGNGGLAPQLRLRIATRSQIACVAGRAIARDSVDRFAAP
jgi:hypothetical protein